MLEYGTVPYSTKGSGTWGARNAQKKDLGKSQTTPAQAAGTALPLSRNHPKYVAVFKH